MVLSLRSQNSDGLSGSCGSTRNGELVFCLEGLILFSVEHIHRNAKPSIVIEAHKIEPKVVNKGPNSMLTFAFCHYVIYATGA